MTHGHEKSDFAIVAMKPANKAEQPAAEQSAAEPTATEPVERRAETKGNAGQQSTHRTQSWVSVSQALERIRQASAVMTRGRSRMRESCMYGSVRGAPSNGRPYRDRRSSSDCSVARRRGRLQSSVDPQSDLANPTSAKNRAGRFCKYLRSMRSQFAFSCTAYRLLAWLAQSGEVLFDAQ